MVFLAKEEHTAQAHASPEGVESEEFGVVIRKVYQLLVLLSIVVTTKFWRKPASIRTCQFLAAKWQKGKGRAMRSGLFLV
jgi:hypothetical protein